MKISIAMLTAAELTKIKANALQTVMMCDKELAKLNRVKPVRVKAESSYIAKELRKQEKRRAAGLPV